MNESLNDIERKLDILILEKNRLLREKDNEANIDICSLSDTNKEEYLKKLEKRISSIEREIDYLEDKQETYYDNLSKMDGIEYRLYFYIVQGIKPTKAIEKVAEENYMKGIKPTTERGIMPYYKNMKKSCGLQ